MQLQKKALYNLVKFSSFHNPSFKPKKWQKEDLRKINENNLFKKLFKLGLNLNKKSFLVYGNEVESPEELVEVLACEKSKEIKDQIYLIVFELYRRLISEKRCLSIFLDELDHRIFLYDIGQLKNDELLQDALANLKSLLDRNVDMGLSYEEAFQNLLKYLAHDLENFLFDYVADQIDAKNESYAFDLIDGFYQYVNKKIWFDFLKAKLKANTNVLLSNQIIKNIIKELKQKPNLEIQFRILKFMIDNGDRDLFIELVKQTTNHLKKENEFKEMLKIVKDYYLRLDKEMMQKKITNLLSLRSKIKYDQNLKKQDISNFLNILS